MLQKYKTKRDEGFTIIEVLIVLAIAGLILLIVFLAVPALQRNSRNNARTNDASRISAAVSECLANRNGNVDQCVNPDNIAVGNRAQLTDEIAVFDKPGANPNDNANMTGSTSKAVVVFGARCNADGDQTLDDSEGIAAREFAVRFQNEPDTQQRCVGS